MTLPNSKPGQILMEREISPAIGCPRWEQSQKGKKLGEILPQSGLMSEVQLVDMLEYALGIPRVSLSNIDIDPEIVKLVPADIIKKYGLMPVGQQNGSILVAMADPLNQQAIDDLCMSSGMEVVPLMASIEELETAIRQYIAFNPDPNWEKLIGQFNHEGISIGASPDNAPSVPIDYEAPVIGLVNSILSKAVHSGCSDIHIEPQENRTRIRFRMDGDLHEAMALSRDWEAAIISRIKILAGMDIAEKRLPQDGRFSLEFDERQADFRVSTLPAVYGEKIVLRILDRSNVITRIECLGLSAENRRKLIHLSRRSLGMILITGPTGSGKTTTLYSILSEINNVKRNIITLEDPVEYSLPGINQIPLNTRAGFGFASGLRSVLRQDPDVIMLGEIRDTETARMAVQAALTGHLLISTLHTSSALGALARLIDMGVEKFLISSALSGIAAQRLVRKLCCKCRIKYSLDGDTAGYLGRPELEGKAFYRSGGCKLCRQSGYNGRLALHEILLVGSRIRDAIHCGSTSEQTISEIARKEGMKTMLEDGIAKAGEGLTSLEEVLQSICLEGEENGSRYNGYFEKRFGI